MLHLTATVNGGSIEETFINTDDLNVDQLSKELRSFTDRAAPRIAYHFAAEYMSQSGGNGLISGDISIYLGEKLVDCISRKVYFLGLGSTINKLSRLEYGIREWMMVKLAPVILYSHDYYEI